MGNQPTNLFLTFAVVAILRLWAVFPLAPRSKVPQKGSNGLLDATRDREQVERWWRETPDANLGIRTGRASGFFVLDIDPRHGGDVTLAKLEAQYGALPATVTVETGGGGWHLYFRMPDFDLRSSSGQVGEGIDVKAEGGYIVAPPSIHPDTGRSYSYFPGLGPDDVEIAVVPEWLIELVSKPSSTAAASGGGEGDLSLVGERNNTLTSLAGSMRRRGFSEAAMQAALVVFNIERCDPPLPEREVAAIAQSVAKYQPAAITAEFQFGSASLRGGSEFEFNAIGAAELLARPVVPVEWLVAGIIPVGGRAIFSGMPGVGKTWLLLDLARAVALGRKWLGEFAVRQGRVLLVDEENSESLLQRRLKLLMSQEAAAGVDIALAQGVRLDAPGHLEALEHLIHQAQPTLVIFDSLVRLHRAEENSAKEMSAVFATVDQLRRDLGITVAFADHMRKPRAGGELSERLRGSGDKLAWVDSLLSVTAESPKPLRMRVEHSKSREDVPVDAFYVDLRVDGDRGRLIFGGGAAAVDDAQLVAGARPLIREVLAEQPMKRKDLLDKMSGREDAPSSRYVAEALQQMIEAEEVVETPEVRPGRGRRAKVLSLVEERVPGAKLGL
jgi:putative DNA primase/helicase